MASRPASPRGGQVALLIAGIAVAAVAIGAGSAWMLSRYREEPLLARTRNRLRQRASHRESASAADIRVD
jgi:hypothetical protein